MSIKNIDLTELIERFGSEDKCHAYLERLRWPDGVWCLRCKSKKISRIATRRQFDCDACRYQFSVRAGTIFHDSKLPLWKWFLAVYMVSQSKKGISANQVKRMLKVSYKTAWYLCHRIRAAMKDEAPDLLRGIVEIDETFIGGHRRRIFQPCAFDNKACVIGAVEKGKNGRLRMAVIPHRGKIPVQAFIKKSVDDATKEIHTDEWPAYKGIADEDTIHRTVNHSKKQYVFEGAHTNTIEGVWSLFSRSVMGSYHKLSLKHMQSYLDEMAFRYNNRGNAYMFRDTILRLVGSERLEYKELTKTI